VINLNKTVGLLREIAVVVLIRLFSVAYCRDSLIRPAEMQILVLEMFRLEMTIYEARKAVRFGF